MFREVEQKMGQATASSQKASYVAEVALQAVWRTGAWREKIFKGTYFIFLEHF